MSLETRYHSVRPTETGSFRSMAPWGKWVFIMLIGSSFGKSFYYLGIPSAKIFIGDFVLFLFCVLRPRELTDRWFRALTQSSVLGPFAWVLLLSILYGMLEVLYGLGAGYSPLTALQNLVFNLYPVYFFLGLWVGAAHPTLLQKAVRWYSWILALYGPAYLLLLHTYKLYMPGTRDVPLFPQAGGGGFILLSLLAFERRPSRYWLPMILCAAMMLAAQVRAEWLSTIIAFLVWGLLERKLGKVSQIATLVVALLVVGFVTDLDLPSTMERGGKVSSREIIARGLSAVSPSLAQELTSSKSTGFYAGTISWRTRWWSAIWDSVSPDKSLTKAALGNGYGYPLKDLVSYLKNEDLRTPHSIFYFALGYSGWIGVAVFFSLQAALFSMLWRAYKLTGQSWGIAVQIMTLVSAFFGNSFEAPMEAIPFYLFMGLFLGPALCRKIVVVPAGPAREQAAPIPARQLAPEAVSL